MDGMGIFVMGAMALASWVIGLFFFKFWRRTHDRLFFIFGCAFWLLGFTRIGLAATKGDGDENEIWYAIRLIAFLLILYAIWDKNRPHAADKEQDEDQGKKQASA